MIMKEKEVTVLDVIDAVNEHVHQLTYSVDLYVKDQCIIFSIMIKPYLLEEHVIVKDATTKEIAEIIRGVNTHVHVH